jgi:hypothetical protein
MLAPLTSGLAIVAAEATSPEKVNHWVVGGILLVLFLALLGILLAFANGREHS